MMQGGIDMGPAIRAVLDRGPSPAAVERLTGSREAVTIRRTLFSNRRPVQFVLDQGGRSFLAELPDAPLRTYASRIIESLAKSRRGQPAAEIVPDPASGLLLRLPGFDRRLPGLRLLHAPQEAGELIGRLEGAARGQPGMTLVAHRLGKRAVLRADFPCGTQRYVRLKPVKADSLQAASRQHDLLAGSGLRLAAPLGVERELGAALYAPLAGRPSRFDGCDLEAIEDTLARLQALALPGLSEHSVEDECALLEDWLHRLSAVYPEDLHIYRTAFERVAAALRALPEVRSVPTHRDLHEHQILIAPEGAGLLDFDTLCRADPGLDAGNLAAHLDFAGSRAGDDLAGREPRRAAWRDAARLRIALIYRFSHTPPARLRALLDLLR